MNGVSHSKGKAVSRTSGETGSRIDAPCAWRAADLKDEDWLLPISSKALSELDELALKLKCYEGPVEALQADEYQLDEVRALMANVRDRLHTGIGFVVLDRLPVENWGVQAAKAIGWLLTTLLGPVVMQKADGTRLYEVQDSGAKLGYGVRRSITNLDQDFHTDGGWLSQAPEIVSLVCLRQASSGGRSRVVSLALAHNCLQEESPALCDRLYRDFWWDRQAEHPPGEAKSSRHPVFSRNGGKLTVRHYSEYIRKGYALQEESLDAEGEAALSAMKAIVDAPENWLEFRLEQGQIEYVNNHLLAHARTAFEDNECQSGRYLLRLWNRREGGVELEPGSEDAK